MKSSVDNNQLETTTKQGTGHAEFNFDLWAKQVRPQLLASVQKRGMR